MSCQGLLRQIAQTAHGGEDRTVEVIVAEDDAKVALQASDECQHRHRVQFRQGAEQGSAAIKAQGSSLQPEGVVEDTENGFVQIHGSLLAKDRNAGWVWQEDRFCRREVILETVRRKRSKWAWKVTIT